MELDIRRATEQRATVTRRALLLPGAQAAGGAAALLLGACLPGQTNAPATKELRGTARVSINASQLLLDAVTQLTDQVRGAHPGVSVEVENIVTASGVGGGWFD